MSRTPIRSGGARRVYRLRRLRLLGRLSHGLEGIPVTARPESGGNRHRPRWCLPPEARRGRQITWIVCNCADGNGTMNSYRCRILEMFRMLVQPYAPLGRWLDFGGGDGWFSWSFAQANL